MPPLPFTPERVHGGDTPGTYLECSWTGSWLFRLCDAVPIIPHQEGPAKASGTNQSRFFHPISRKSRCEPQTAAHERRNQQHTHPSQPQRPSLPFQEEECVGWGRRGCRWQTSPGQTQTIISKLPTRDGQKRGAQHLEGSKTYF